MLWKKKLKDAIQLKETGAINIDATDALAFDCYENYSLTFFLEASEDSALKVYGDFRHSFLADDAERILRKQSVLSHMFKMLQLDYDITASLGVESLEEGYVLMQLRPKTFPAEDTDAILLYCVRFIETIMLIHAVELYED